MQLWELTMELKFVKLSKIVLFYRDDGLAIFKNINDHGTAKIREEFLQLFMLNGLFLETERNLKVVNYLDITLDFNTGIYNHIANLMMKYFI